MAKVKTSDERRLLVLKGRELTLRGKQAQNADEVEKVKAEIVALKKKGVR